MDIDIVYIYIFLIFSHGDPKLNLLIIKSALLCYILLIL